MKQHASEQLLEALKERKWSVKKVFGMERRIVTAFSLVHAVDGIDDVHKREAVIRARAVSMVVEYLVVLFGEALL